MPSFNDLTQIILYIETCLDEVLESEVAEFVEEKIIGNVSKVVYGAGDPLIYHRRGLNNGDGLGGRSSIHHHLIKDGVLEVTDDAQAQYPLSIDLDQLIENGYGNKTEWYNQSRDFIEQTREELMTDGELGEVIRLGLIKRGLNAI